MDYDHDYEETADYFGTEPEDVLVAYADRIDRSRPVLDIGAGQGRNALHLARLGYTVEAIDPSTVAVRTLSAAAEREALPLQATCCGFETFTPKSVFAAVLLFGIIPEQSRETIALMPDKIDHWTVPGSLVFATAFTTGDPGFGEHSTKWKAIGENSFSGDKGRIRTYLRPGELLVLFPEWRVLHYWEGLGPEHRHGNRPPERHAKVEAVFSKQRPMPGDLIRAAAEAARVIACRDSNSA